MSETNRGAASAADDYPVAKVAEGSWLRGATGMWLLAALCNKDKGIRNVLSINSFIRDFAPGPAS